MLEGLLLLFTFLYPWQDGILGHFTWVSGIVRLTRSSDPFKRSCCPFEKGASGRHFFINLDGRAIQSDLLSSLVNLFYISHIEPRRIYEACLFATSSTFDPRIVKNGIGGFLIIRNAGKKCE